MEGVDVALKVPFDLRAQTFTATCSPVSASTALWTWAIEAAATGSENSEKTEGSGTSKLVLDHLHRDPPREGGKLVLQNSQLQRQVFAHHVGPGRQDLPRT